MVLFGGRYQYDETSPLGSGVFGVVYEAFDQHQKQPVALKLLRKGAPPIQAYAEAQILTELRGKFVLQIFNAGTADDIPFLATEIAPHGSAEDKIKTESPFGVAPDLAVAWTRNTLLGLASAHARGIVHRDVKPGNIFLDRHDWALVGDFGVAAPLDATDHVSQHGDPLICSPEMYANGQGDVRSDIYSTGVTMYRLLTGRWPFEAGTIGDLRALVLAGVHPSLGDASPHVTRALASRVERAMAVDPAARYQTAREMHEALARASLVRRAWERIPPHAGHDRCWLERPGLAGRVPARFQACVVATPGGYALDCKRIGGLHKRVTDHCRTDLTEQQLLVRLRTMFRALT